MTTIPMTRDRFHRWTPLVLMPVLLAQPFFVFWAIGRGARPLPPAAAAVLFGALGSVWVVLAITALMAPRAVTLTADELVIERWAWPAFRVPLADIAAVAAGPTASLWGGQVCRVAGNGGWFWSGGLFHAHGVGRVRAWLTRLGPTVVLRRVRGLPMLLSAENPEGLMAAVLSAKRARK